MISQITNIKDFGVFRNFNWPSGLDDFKRYNVFYGWNYSGKTTVSRIFRCFELGRLHDDFENATFAIKDGTSSIYDHTHLSDYPIAIRVFNEDFVRDNLKWEQNEQGEEGIEPILILGEKNIELEKRLIEKREALAQKKIELNNHNSKRAEKEISFNTTLRDKARDITDILSLGRTFLKTHLEQKIEGIDKPSNHILSGDEVTSYLIKYQSMDKKPKEPPLTLRYKHQPGKQEEKKDSTETSDISLTNEAISVKNMLKRTVTAKIIQKLKDDQELSEWVRKGRELHEGKNICEFCGNKLSEERIAELNAYFSDEYESFISKVDTSIKTLANKKIEIDFPDKTRFYKEFQNKYSESGKVLCSELEKYNSVIDNMIRKLNQKKAKVFQAVQMEEIDDNTSKIRNTLENINLIIQKHNQRTDQFERERDDAKEKLLKHYESEFIQDHNYYGNKEEIEGLKNKITIVNKDIHTTETAISQIENQLSDTAKGAETINKYIQSYFGKGDITIEPVEQGKFKLKRSEDDAKNLSQGEKTAISFAYFVSKLHEKNTDIRKTIVFIDDPVSSLDTNHLFHTYAMIKNTFKEWPQFFIATHNFELFNLIKDWLKDKPSKTPHSYYLVKREVSKDHFASYIYNLPAELRKFKSEYHYLFSLIYNFHKCPSSDHNVLYNVPNLVRRLLEAFMGFKVPIYASLYRKLPLLIADGTKREKVWKFISQYSHNKSLPRSLQFPDLSECEEVVSTVLNNMKNMDPEHYDCLIDEIEGKTDVVNERLRKRRKVVVAKPEKKVEGSIKVFSETIKIKTIGRAAARNGTSVIEFSETVYESSLKPFACAYVTGYTFDPIARYGQYILLAQQDEVAVDGDLVAVESLDGERYLRRMAVDGDILILSSINPNKVISPIQINIDKVLVYKVMGVIYESTLLSRGGETIHDGEWQPYEKFDISFFDDLKMVTVEGDSLEPIALEGQRVLVGVPKNPDQYSIENGGLAAIETKDDIGHVIKRVFRKENEWTLVSPNPLASYPPDIVSVEKIEKVWPLYGVIFETKPDE